MNDNSQQTWPDVIEGAKERFMEVKPPNMDFTSERAFAVQHLQNNEYLLKTAKESPSSLQQAMLNVAAVGLSLNPAIKQAYLVPRGGKVCFDASYRGLCDMATDSGAIKWLQANLVYSNDEFIDNGPGHEPTHKYNPFAKQEERGDFRGAYCVAKTADGDYLTTVMTAEEIESVKNRSESAKKGYGPWITDYSEMAKKTVVKRAFKMLPKTESLDRMGMAVQLSHEAEEFEPIKSSPDLGSYSEEQKKYFDQKIEEGDAIGMFLFVQSIEEKTYINLYHSFEKGSKGKYQRVVDELVNKGQSLLTDMVEVINQHAENQDESGIKENIEGLSGDAIDWLQERVTDDAKDMIGDCRG